MIVHLLLFLRGVIDRCLLRVGAPIPQSVPPSLSEEKEDALDIAFVSSMNEKLSGWFNRDTSELYTDFQVGSKDQVLDVGCGNGRYLSFCAQQGAHLSWVDIEQHKVEKIHAALKDSAAASLSGYVSDSQPLPFETPFASRIIASEVMEHVDNPHEFLAELYRVGVPGAKYLITVPHEKSENTLKKFAPPEHFQKPNHINIFSEQDLEDLLYGAGFEIISQENMGFYQAVWWLLIWIAPGDGLSAERIRQSSLMSSWVRTWSELLKNPRGAEVKLLLDEIFPKRRVVVARKPLA
ncbi:MAG: class I SAM-dependent methyltransferase [Halioglobus sp.]